jgi:hypothetical protein
MFKNKKLKVHFMKYFFYLILVSTLLSCTQDEEVVSNETEYNIWIGPNIEFTKAAGSDPQLDANQDSITKSVSITRGNYGGEIYNIFLETEASKGASPMGTEWAIGEVSNISSLTFQSFRNAVGSPKQVVGKSLVLHLIEEDQYISVEFKSWGQQHSGSFSYVRTTRTE